MKILYIEDDHTVRLTMTRMLRRWYGLGADDLRIAESADEAIDHIKTSVLEREFDLVLSDYNLLGTQTGGDVLAWIKKHVSHLEGRFLFLSGNAAVHALHPHCVDKACELSELRATIDNLITNRS